MYVDRYLRVCITWIRPENGGRKSLVTSLCYRPAIYLDDVPEDVWSFPLEFKSLPNYEEPTEAIGSFLTDSCPWEKMFKSKTFEVRDGITHTIGYGKVLEVCCLEQPIDVHWDSLPCLQIMNDKK